MRPRHLFPILAIFASASIASCQAGPTKWDELKAYFDIPKDASKKVESTLIEDPRGVHEKLKFVSPGGGVAQGDFIRPKDGAKFPVVVLLHGLNSNKDVLLQAVGNDFLRSGIAVLALDAPKHGLRRTQEDMQIFMKLAGPFMQPSVPGDIAASIVAVDADASMQRSLIDMFLQGTRDYRVALDWLENRPDIDVKRIGLAGVSMGGIMGAQLMGVDKRISHGVLMVAADPFQPLLTKVPLDLRGRAETLCACQFVAHAAGRRIDMLNAVGDQLFPKSAVDRLFNAAAQPKALEWFEGQHSPSTGMINRAKNLLIDGLGRK